MGTDLRLIVPATISLVILLSACSAKYSDISSAERTERYQAFTIGRAVLDCGLNCSGYWGSERSTLLQLLAAQKWPALAQKVLEIGYNNDLAWYYLGRAAEGLNRGRAAQIYYYKAMSGVKACDGAINNCDGFKFPDDARKQLDALERSSAVNNLPASPQ